jgi:hypothetical protein
MGVAGACGCNELTYLKIENVQDKGKYLFITIADTKTYVSRSFTVMEEGFSVNTLDMCRRYMQLRPVYIASQGKCISPSLGINTMSRILQWLLFCNYQMLVPILAIACSSATLLWPSNVTVDGSRLMSQKATLKILYQIN